MKLFLFSLFLSTVLSLTIRDRKFENLTLTARQTSTSFGKGIGMFYWYDRSLMNNLNCMKNEGYDSLFIYIYYNASVEDEALNVINDLYSKDKDFKMEFMLLPTFTNSNLDKSPEDVIAAVNESLTNIPLSPKFMWLDTYFLGSPDSNANIDYITRLRAAAQNLDIRVDILTSSDVWQQHMDNTDVFKKQGVLNWDDQSSSHVIGEYGGWNNAAIIASKPHYENCSIYHAGISYNIQALESRTKVAAPTSIALLLSLVLSFISLKL